MRRCTARIYLPVSLLHMLFQAFFAKCAFRFPARSGLIPWVMDLIPSWPLLGRSWALLNLLGPRFLIFFACGAHLCSKWRFEAICFDFSSILDGFGRDFGTIFQRFFVFLLKSRFCENRCFSPGKFLFLRIRAFKHQRKIN